MRAHERDHLALNRLWLRTYFSLVVKQRWWFLIATTLTTLILGVQIGGITLNNDPDLWTPQTHPYVKATKVIEEIFGGRNIIVIGIASKHGDIYTPETLAKIQRIQRAVERLPQAVRHNVLSLAAGKVKAIRGTPDGIVAREMLTRIPLNSSEIAELKAAIATQPIYINALVSADGRTAAVVADFKISRDNPNYLTLYEAVRQIAERERDSQTDIFYGGPPVQSAWMERYTEAAGLYFGIAFLIILGIQYLSFRTLQGMLLPVITALLSVIWSLGLLRLFGISMDVLNTTTPILIMAVATGHALQVLKRYYEEYEQLLPRTSDAVTANRRAIVESLTAVGPAMLTAGLIAAITFASLTVSDIAIIRNFGLFASVGVISTIVLELTFVPALRASLPPPRPGAVAPKKESAVGWMLTQLSMRLVGGGAAVVLGTSAILLLVAFAGVVQLRVDNSFKSYMIRSDEVRSHDAALNSQLGGTNTVYFLIEGRRPDDLKDPSVLNAIVALQHFLDKQEFVGKTQSIADFVRRMNLAMNADDPAYDKIPHSRDVVSQYLFLYALSADPNDFDNFIDANYQRAVIWAYLKTDSTRYTEELYRRAKAVIGSQFPSYIDVRIGGSLPSTMAINDVVIHEKLRNILQMAVMIFVLSSLILRSWIGGLFVVAPVLIIVLVNFGLMGWLNIPLDMGTTTTASMAIGIGADYEIYLLLRLREEICRGRDLLQGTRLSILTSGKAIVYVALSIAGGYSVLLLSDFAFYDRLAVMVGTTMLTSALCAVVILRSMMILTPPRFLFAHASGIITRREAF